MRKKDSKYVLKWAKRIKAIYLMGGECSRCGNSDFFVLSFHHINGETKEDKIQKLSWGRWSLFEKEISKCSLLCHNCHYKLHSNRNSKNKRHSKLKIDLLNYKGVNECQKCGYSDDSLCSLDFHHLEENEKEFSLRDVGSSMKGGFHRIAKEIDKCSVLCKNCHQKGHIDTNRFAKFKDSIFLKMRSMTEKQKKVDRDIVIDMYVNKKMKQIDISKKMKCAKSTVSGIIKHMAD